MTNLTEKEFAKVVRTLIDSDDSSNYEPVHILLDLAFERMGHYSEREGDSMYQAMEHVEAASKLYKKFWKKEWSGLR